MEIFVYQWGTDVHCGDDVCGKLSRVVVNPETGKVSSLIVEQGLLMMKKARVVPQAAVEQADEEGIWLNLSEEELGALAPYQRRVIEEVAPGHHTGSGGVTATSLGTSVGTFETNMPMVQRVVHEGISSPDLVVLKSGAEVADQLEQKKLGKLEKIVVDSRTGEIAQLVVKPGLFGDEVSLPGSAVQAYDEDKIHVQRSGEPVVRGTAEQEEGLSGEGGSQRAFSLHTRVDVALRKDARTRDEVIEVVEQGGVVTLIGEVQDRATSEAAREIAAGQKGVVLVHNNLIPKG